MVRLFSPAFNQQFFDENGKPLAAGKLYTYVAGSSTPVFTYKSITGSERNTNPIILDAAGYADFVLELGVSYKFILKDKNDFFQKQWDNVTAADISQTLEQLVTDIDGKADKANPATNGHLAALTSNGNLKDSGYEPSDFATKEQGEKADTAYQMPVDGIPKSDMAQGVKDSLDKADSAIQANDLIKFVRVDQRQNFSDNEKRNGRLNIAAIQGRIMGAYWPIVNEDLLDIYVNTYFEILNLHYESDLGAPNPRGIVSSLVPRAEGTDYGKVPVVMPIDPSREGDHASAHHLEYLRILQECATSSETELALARGQIPCFKNASGTFVPYLADATGVMHLYNVFGVVTQDPMTGDALGLSINYRAVNGNLVPNCLWGKPYGINYFEFATAKANDNLSMGTSPTKMEWRRVPIDRSLTISRIGLIGLSSTIEKDLMVGIFSYDGTNVTKVSDVANWSQVGATKYIHKMDDVFTIDDMIDDTSSSYYFVEFALGSAITLEAGKNYFFPCRYNSQQTYDDPYVCVYKKATPALPFEEIWRNTAQYGNPDPSTAKEGRKPTCLRVTLSDGTKMWI